MKNRDFLNNAAKIFLILFPLEKFGCKENSVTTVKVSLNTDFDIKYGQAAYIPDDDLLITFKEVADGRCPKGLKCYWEGSAYITLVIRQDWMTKIDTVQTFVPEKIIKIDTSNFYYKFVVKRLAPYPIYGKEIVKENCTLTLNISRLTYTPSKRSISGSRTIVN